MEEEEEEMVAGLLTTTINHMNREIGTIGKLTRPQLEDHLMNKVLQSTHNL